MASISITITIIIGADTRKRRARRREEEVNEHKRRGGEDEEMVCGNQEMRRVYDKERKTDVGR